MHTPPPRQSWDSTRSAPGSRVRCPPGTSRTSEHPAHAAPIPIRPAVRHRIGQPMGHGSAAPESQSHRSSRPHERSDIPRHEAASRLRAARTGQQPAANETPIGTTPPGQPVARRQRGRPLTDRANRPHEPVSGRCPDRNAQGHRPPKIGTSPTGRTQHPPLHDLRRRNRPPSRSPHQQSAPNRTPNRTAQKCAHKHPSHREHIPLQPSIDELPWRQSSLGVATRAHVRAIDRPICALPAAHSSWTAPPSPRRQRPPHNEEPPCSIPPVSTTTS